MRTSNVTTTAAEKEFEAGMNRWLSLYRQATSALKASKMQRREKLLIDCLKIARRMKEIHLAIAPDSPDAALIAEKCLRSSLRELGLTYRLLDADPAEDRCLPYLLEALSMEEKVKEGKSSDFYLICDALCSTYVAKKQMVKYEEIARKALAYKEKEVGQWHPEVANYLLDLAWALEEQGKWAESAAIKKDALGICEADPEHLEVDRIALKHGIAYTNLRGQGESELQAVQKAMETLSEDERKLFTERVAEELGALR